jgi:hypothetical protein
VDAAASAAAAAAPTLATTAAAAPPTDDSFTGTEEEEEGQEDKEDVQGMDRTFDELSASIAGLTPAAGGYGAGHCERASALAVGPGRRFLPHHRYAL